jgi:hypothetical protein
MLITLWAVEVCPICPSFSARGLWADPPVRSCCLIEIHRVGATLAGIMRFPPTAHRCDRWHRSLCPSFRWADKDWYEVVKETSDPLSALGVERVRRDATNGLAAWQPHWVVAVPDEVCLCFVISPPKVTVLTSTVQTSPAPAGVVLGANVTIRETRSPRFSVTLKVSCD